MLERVALVHDTIFVADILNFALKTWVMSQGFIKTLQPLQLKPRLFYLEVKQNWNARMTLLFKKHVDPKFN